MQSGNLYVYCMSNAVVYLDSNGNVALAVAEIALGAVATVAIAAAVASPAGQQAMSDFGDAIVGGLTAIGDAVSNAWKWIKGLFTTNSANSMGGSTPDDPNNNKNDKPSLRKVDKRQADRIARENGYKDAHAMKEYLVGRKQYC
jgi:hypothetical protein